jgi:hypothetical protein
VNDRQVTNEAELMKAWGDAVNSIMEQRCVRRVRRLAKALRSGTASEELHES